MIGASGFLSKRVNRRQVQETIWYRFDLLGFSHSSVRREQHVWWNACSFHWLCCSCPSPQSRLVLGDAKLAFAKNSDVETTVARRLECFFFRVPASSPFHSLTDLVSSDTHLSVQRAPFESWDSIWAAGTKPGSPPRYIWKGGCLGTASVTSLPLSTFKAATMPPVFTVHSEVCF